MTLYFQVGNDVTLPTETDTTRSTQTKIKSIAKRNLHGHCYDSKY